MRILSTPLLPAALLWGFTLSADLGQTDLRVGTVPGYPGVTVPVPVALSQPPDSAFAAQFDVEFDPARVTAGTPVATQRLLNYVVKSRQLAPGVLRTLIYSPANLPVTGTNGAILEIPFTVAAHETVSSGPLRPVNVIVASGEGRALLPLSANAGTIFVRVVNVQPDGRVQFFLPSTEGARYAIQASSDLQHWLNISTNTATGGFLDLLDIDGREYPHRFYRWLLLAP